MIPFLPVSRADLAARGWEEFDFLLITGDAYVDHPSFGAAVIARVLENEGYRVALLCQPSWRKEFSFTALGRPRLGVMVTGGNLDSMVAHYTAAKRRRSDDAYSPGNKAGLRPDRAVTVYCRMVRQVFGDIPIIIGGLEASLRRFAHYDYWEDAVRPSVLVDSTADLLIYGMGETAVRAAAAHLAAGTPVAELTTLRGTAYLTQTPDCAYPAVECAPYDTVKTDKRAYAEAAYLQYIEHDAVVGRALLQRHGKQMLVVNPPAPPLGEQELDTVAELSYARAPHPMYNALGGVPAIEEVRFSVIHNRGCFGACHFCSLAFHQGRMVTARSHDSVTREVAALTNLPDFKGYIHDVGGPTANFRRPSCKKQLKEGLCKNRVCLGARPCPNLDADHSDYLALLRRLRALPKVKKIFIRSGIRYDFMERDKNGTFFAELAEHHVSGQLKVAPEHCVPSVLDYMGKPHIEVYERFKKQYDTLSQRYDKKQFLVPYLISSHPGCTLQDAVRLAEWLHKTGRQPEQVQDFYPTPGTLSTCMYHTGLDPRTLKPVYVAKTPKDKAMQRALLQWRRPEKRALVLEALRLAGREDLIGFGKHCLIRPSRPPGRKGQEAPQGKKQAPPAPQKRGKGWATPKSKKNKPQKRSGGRNGK